MSPHGREHDDDGRRWHISTHSQTAQTCVEVSVDTVTHIRDSKDRTIPMITVGAQAWAAFLPAADRPPAGR